MIEILDKIFGRLLNKKKGFKIVAWIFIILIILAIVFYPIIDANFLYYNRTNKRVKIIKEIVSINEDDIRKDPRIQEEYNSILNDMGTQRNNYINNIFQEEVNTGRKIAKFISGAWLFILVGIAMLVKNKENRFSLNNIMGVLICFIIGVILGFICLKIPNIINFMINIILYQIILMFLIYTITTSSKKA